MRLEMFVGQGSQKLFDRAVIKKVLIVVSLEYLILTRGASNGSKKNPEKSLRRCQLTTKSDLLISRKIPGSHQLPKAEEHL